MKRKGRRGGEVLSEGEKYSDYPPGGWNIVQRDSCEKKPFLKSCNKRKEGDNQCPMPGRYVDVSSKVMGVGRGG